MANNEGRKEKDLGYQIGINDAREIIIAEAEKASARGEHELCIAFAQLSQEIGFKLNK